MSGDEGLPTAGGRRRRSPEPATPLENDDLLSDILLRLPPTPSSLPCASLVCKRWHRLVSAPAFVRSFRARHRRNAPLLGFFSEGPRGISFTSTLEPPDRLPDRHFTLKLKKRCRIVGCRHGLVLTLDETDHHFLVWEPATGDVSRVAIPSRFGSGGSAEFEVKHAAGLRAPGDVHATEDHSIPFLVALVGVDQGCTRTVACVYSSETGVWGNLISMTCPSWPSMVPVCTYNPSTLVGSSLYWLLFLNRTAILEFDLDRQLLAVIDAPLNNLPSNRFRYWVMPAE